MNNIRYFTRRKEIFKMARRIFSTLIVLSSIFLYSQTSLALTIGPSRFEVTLPPGEIAVTDYFVQNETEKPVHVTVEPENWFKDAYAYEDLVIEDWLKLDTYEFSLEPKEIKKIKLTIIVPTDIKGEIVAQIFFTSGVLTEEGQPAGVRARLGAVLYVAIEGTEKINASIESITISKVTEQGEEKTKIALQVRNKGNVHIRPKGKILIENRKKEKIDELELLSGRATLPGQYHTYYAYWKEPKLKNGSYKIHATIDYGEIFNVDKTATKKKSFKVNKKGAIVLK